MRSAAELLHIENLLDRQPNNLSGGQRQRVAVARAIAYDADLLLMDEPLSNLDALLRMEMRAELKRLVKEIEATVIYVTHDQTEALSMGDRVAVMNEGRLVQLDKPIEIYDHPADTFVAGFIGNPPMNILTGIVVPDGDGIDLENGDRVHAAVGDREPGTAATIGVRAENIRVERDPGDWTIRGKVLVVEPLGSHNLLTVDCDGRVIRASTDADHWARAGDEVFLHAVTDKVRWLEEPAGVSVD